MDIRLMLVVCLWICIAQIQSTKEIDDLLLANCNLTQHSKDVTDESPWVPIGYSYRPGVAGLHTEIEHFNAYMMPTPTERAMRNQVLKCVQSLTMDVWPSARVEIFGSYRSGLFLPNSDIDLSVSGAQGPFPLRVLVAKILASKMAEPNSVVLIEKARVPVIKLIDRQTKLNVDISMNNDGIATKIEWVNEYKRKYPVLPKLVIVLKQFLKFHDLNTSYTGGISSFSLVLMCVSFLQLQPVDRVGENANLGVLLLDFLELYGKTFDYGSNCIRVTNDGQYLFKESALRLISHDHRTQHLCIEDPQNPLSNTARPTYRAHQVQCAFENAFNLLSNAISPNQKGGDFSSEHDGPLGGMVQVEKKVIEHRNWVRNTFKPE